MEDNSVQKARTHNTVVGIITVACFGTIAGSLALEWEFWVPPLIVCALIAMWVLHITQYGTWEFRENYYLILSMLLSFYHGVHRTSIFEIVVVSALLMVNVTLFGRKEYITIMLAEGLILIAMHVFIGVRTGYVVLDTLTVSKLALHIIGELCIYKGLKDAVTNNHMNRQELERRNGEKENSRQEMEDFLVNISHELRTPVNVINGMSTLILNREDSEDVEAIRDAGVRLSRQIEDIQDYSEIQRGEVVLEEGRYMITSVLNDIESNYRVLFRRDDLELIISLDPEVPAMLYGDAGKISKIIMHLLSNAEKYTRRGGIYLKVTGIRRDYGINLLISVTDTGSGMTREDVERITQGRHQADTSRNRRTGGIGLGLSIVYGFVRQMKGFVNIESKPGKGTTVSISLAQKIVDPVPCLSVETGRFLNVVMCMDSDAASDQAVHGFYSEFISGMASALRINVYAASDNAEVRKLMKRGDITHVIISQREYKASRSYYDEIAEGDVKLAVLDTGSIYTYSVVRLLSDDALSDKSPYITDEERPALDGIRALVVDDEPMNLVVAKGLFRDYNMIIDTAESGKEALSKFENNNYDIVFMDHMMPEMDGIEAMKYIKEMAEEQHKTTRVIALTANAISGAREMFLREGFDGFISKPINVLEFERVMNRVLNSNSVGAKETSDDQIPS